MGKNKVNVATFLNRKKRALAFTRTRFLVFNCQRWEFNHNFQSHKCQDHTRYFINFISISKLFSYRIFLSMLQSQKKVQMLSALSSFFLYIFVLKKNLDKGHVFL